MNASSSRLDYLDATRAFALVLGVVFHASLSFLPTFMGWAVQDISTSPAVSVFLVISHSFRMELFFLLAGFFGCVTLRRKGVGAFVRSRAMRLGVPFVVGWFLLRPLVVSGWIMGSASLRGDFDFWAGILAGFQSLKTLPAGIFTGSHLWFLYYLALVTALTLVARAVLALTGSWRSAIARRADAVVAWLAHSPFSLPLLCVPTAAALWFMRFWAMDTPDQTLVPNLPVLVVYGGFFMLGWMIGRQFEVLTAFTRLVWYRWVFAGVGIVGVLMLGPIERDPGHVAYMAAHIGYALSYALMMGSLVGLTIGVFRKLFVRPQAWVRYVADSSYWMYLVHLPVVVWLQVAIAEVELNWSVKLAGVSVVTIAIALISYDLFVRSTIIGQVLNGRRQERVFGLRALRIRSNAPRARSASASVG
jgi:peptidoglycan/LPS O-acetylase OafA/YrhL